MSKSVTVLKVFPKINGQFVASYSEMGFQLSASKNKGIHFSANENKTVEDMMIYVNRFIEFANSFGLNITFDVSRVVTTSERTEGLSVDELLNNVGAEKDED